jgi:hypothetical protein
MDRWTPHGRCRRSAPRDGPPCVSASPRSPSRSASTTRRSAAGLCRGSCAGSASVGYGSCPSRAWICCSRATMRDVAYGDGTITKRSDGRLQVTVNVAGKRRFAMVPARLVRTDPKAARRKAEELRRELVDKRDAGIEPSSQTLAVFLRSWIDGLRDARRQRVRPRTLDHYALIVERHIVPALGKHRLDRLSERHVQAWLDGDAGSPRTVPPPPGSPQTCSQRGGPPPPRRAKRGSGSGDA